MRVFLLFEDYKKGVEQEIKVTPFFNKEKALFYLKRRAEEDMKIHDDTVVTFTEDSYENYAPGFFDEDHAVIYIQEKEVL